MSSKTVRTIQVKGRAVKLNATVMPDGSVYVAGRYARAIFSGTAETADLAADIAESEAREFERTYTH